MLQKKIINLPCRIQIWGPDLLQLRAEQRRCPSQCPRTCPEAWKGTWPPFLEASEESTPYSNPEIVFVKKKNRLVAILNKSLLCPNLTYYNLK